MRRASGTWKKAMGSMEDELKVLGTNSKDRKQTDQVDNGQDWLFTRVACMDSLRRLCQTGRMYNVAQDSDPRAGVHHWRCRAFLGGLAWGHLSKCVQLMIIEPDQHQAADTSSHNEVV
jgi:hypothetical protein